MAAATKADVELVSCGDPKYRCDKNTYRFKCCAATSACAKPKEGESRQAYIDRVHAVKYKHASKYHGKRTASEIIQASQPFRSGGENDREETVQHRVAITSLVSELYDSGNESDGKRMSEESIESPHCTWTFFIQNDE